MGCCASSANFKELDETQLDDCLPDNMPKSTNEYDFLFKVIMIGDNSSGKSALIHSFEANEFKESTSQTVGIEFSTRVMTSQNGKKIKLQLWDCAGHGDFDDILSVYYEGAHGCIFVYDVCNPKSFENIKIWHQIVQRHTSPRSKIVFLMIANKIDQEEERVIDTESGRELANELNIENFFECSAKTGENVEKAIQTLTDDLDSTFSKFLEERM